MLQPFAGRRRPVRGRAAQADRSISPPKELLGARPSRPQKSRRDSGAPVSSLRIGSTIGGLDAVRAVQSASLALLDDAPTSPASRRLASAHAALGTRHILILGHAPRAPEPRCARLFHPGLNCSALSAPAFPSFSPANSSIALLSQKPVTMSTVEAFMLRHRNRGFNG